MEQTWRWFGPEDTVSLAHIRQAGATGIVTALYHVPPGDVWTVDEIEKRKAVIEADPALGLRWSVVESLPVADSIKMSEGKLPELFDNYRQSLRNLAKCGVRTVCYNFMPLLDWTRTKLRHPLPAGGRALRFNAHELAAFDCFILQRTAADGDHKPDVLRRAKAWFDQSTDAARRQLVSNIIAGLPGALVGYGVREFRELLDRYRGMTADRLRQNFAQFLKEVVPTAEEVGVRLCVHPDDPPRPLFGLPRIVSNADDLAFIVDAVKSPSNGITLCTGSLGAGPTNDVPAIAERFARHVAFAHLRNVTKEPDGSFMEADHLAGDTDMVAVVTILLKEQKRRQTAGERDWRIPMRPDHGHELLDDIGKQTRPGYSAIGRLKGLAELRGVMAAVSQLQKLPP